MSLVSTDRQSGDVEAYNPNVAWLSHVLARGGGRGEKAPLQAAKSGSTEAQPPAINHVLISLRRCSRPRLLQLSRTPPGSECAFKLNAKESRRHFAHEVTAGLREMGATLSLGCINGGRSLLLSAGNGDAETIREALAIRPELAAATYFGNGQNIAHIAAEKGDREVLEAVVEVLQAAVKTPDADGLELSLKAQAAKAVTVGKCLKDVINGQSSNGQTPLMLACQNGHVSCVNFLLDSGAAVFTVDRTQRRSAIHYAAVNGQVGVLRALLDDARLLHTEDGLCSLKNVRVHDMSGQCRYIDSRAENGVTALHLAAVHGEVACVHVLLAAGASMMVRTVDLEMLSTIPIPAGSTPLHLAAQRGQVAIVQAMLQAHADALGNWARDDGDERGGRRGWEQDGRIDLRSVANSLRQLPYHVAWQRGFRQAAQVLNPTIPIDTALENVRELEEGVGSQKLQTLAAYALRKNLVDWLELFETRLCDAEKEHEQRELRERVIAEQRRKEALKFHSQLSAEASLAAHNARIVSSQDAGHTISLADPARDGAPDLSLIAENSDEFRNSVDVSRRSEQQTQRSPGVCLTSEVPCASAFDELPEPLSPQQNAGLKAASPKQSGGQQPSFSSRSNRKSRRRLVPSRPAPPPPLNRAPSASERALAMAAMPPAAPAAPAQQRGHHRRVSWDMGDSKQAEASEITELQAPSPFASPFAQISAAAADDARETGAEDEGLFRVPISSHPSGVDLVDPPETGGGVLLEPRQSLSRRGSKALLSAIPSFRSRKSLQLKTELSAQIDFKRAVSIPGFDNNLDADEDCGICLDEAVNVGINGCCHKLCCDCALKLCRITKKPPLCPFCRTFIDGFHPATNLCVKM